jgi:hypothetical protein
VGGSAGGLVGALTSHDISDADARAYSEAVRRGDSLVIARADENDAARVEALLQRQGGVDSAAGGTTSAANARRENAMADSTRF